MSSARKCDICGKFYEPEKYVPDLTIHRYVHPYGERRLELCKECQAELEKFVNNKIE